MQVLRKRVRVGASVTFRTIAATALVSRSWLYSKFDIRAEIQYLHDTIRGAASPPILAP